MPFGISGRLVEDDFADVRLNETGTGDGRALRGTHKRGVSTQEDWRALGSLRNSSKP
nr:MAG TPA: hypothetical protein [Caudoviricetes sp.]